MATLGTGVPTKYSQRDQVGKEAGHAPIINQVMSFDFFSFFFKINKLTNKYTVCI